MMQTPSDAQLVQLRGLIEPILVAEQVELVELSLRPVKGELVLRLLVHTPTGITLDHCAALNRMVGDALEADTVLTAGYVLEVASPGLDRPLHTMQDFQRAIGARVEVHVRMAVNGQKTYVGSVTVVDERSVTLETKKHGRVMVPLEHITTAKRQLRW
jgi:ribosome maturation factor RimP